MVLHRQKLPFFASEQGERLKKPIIGEKKYEMRVLFNEIDEPGKWISEANSEFLLLLTSNGFSVNKLEKGPITYSVIKNFDILVMGSNRSGSMEISAGEFRAINQFVSDGRGLLFVGNEFIGNDDVYNNYLLQVFGACFSSTIMKGGSDVPAMGIEDAPLIDIFIEHPITNNVFEIYIPLNASIHIDIKKSVEPIALSSPDCKPYCAPILAILNHGKGKVAFLGSEGIFSNNEKVGISIKDNSKFIFNLFNWFPKWVQCPNCELMNPPGEKYCSRCRAVI
ncbi:MAG: hypothetical protein ACTSPY_02920 [Candidatus Helarchaeota archaeon]